MRCSYWIVFVSDNSIRQLSDKFSFVKSFFCSLDLRGFAPLVCLSSLCSNIIGEFGLFGSASCSLLQLK